MMSESGRAAAVDFWHCAKCKTPNPVRSYLTTCLGCGSPRTAKGAAEATAAPRSAPTRSSAPRDRRGSWLIAATWVYAVLVLAALATIRWVGETWSPAVLLLFLPRWLFLVPLIPLALANLRARRPSVWALTAAIALVVAGPLMNASLPIKRLWAARVDGERFRVMTFNQGLKRLDARALIRTIELQHIDLICFQEGTANPDLDTYFSSRGWHRDKSKWLASRLPIVAELNPLKALTEKDMQGKGYPAILSRARLRTRKGTEFILASVHLPTLRFGIDQALHEDFGRLKVHVNWWGDELGRVMGGLCESRDTPILVGGDFNMPSDSSTMAGLKTVFQFGFDESGWGYGYTRPTSVPWVRIDHLLASPEWDFHRCWVGPHLGSDHLPLIAEVILTPSSQGLPASLR